MISTLFRIILHRLLSFIEQDFRNKISFSFDLELIRSTRSPGQILSDYARSVSGSGIDFRPGSLMIIEHVPPSLSSSFPPSFRFFSSGQRCPTNRETFYLVEIRLEWRTQIRQSPSKTRLRLFCRALRWTEYASFLETDGKISKRESIFNRLVLEKW